MRAARLQGTSVEILDQRTSTRTVRANPDGTLTADVGVVPRQVKRGNVWMPVDTTLVQRQDGLVGPKATEGDLALSRGGAAPLVSLRRDGRSFSLYWQGALPAPRLAGNSATYPGVFPGVDLVMYADHAGVRQHLVIANADAARNPALTSIRLRVDAPGLTVRVDEDGGIHAADNKGVDVFGAPPSYMWDSSSTNHATARSAKVGVSFVDGTLVLTPDQRFLRDPALVYPVVVDPSPGHAERNAWATVLSGKPDQSYWWSSGEPPWAQVGQCYREVPDRCNNIAEAWAYFRFDTSFLGGKQLLAATFDSTVVYSPSCQVHTHDLYRTDHWITFEGNLTWNNRPFGHRVAGFGAPTVRSSCLTPGGIGINVKDHLNFAGLTTFYLRAADGGAQHAWRKYDPTKTRISLTYNQIPGVPTNLVTAPSTDPAQGDQCRWCGERRYVGDKNITLNATMHDGDDTQLYSNWIAEADGARIDFQDILGPAGRPHKKVLDLDRQELHNKTITWHVRGNDTHALGGFASGRPFVVDRTPVQAAPHVSSNLYSSEENSWHGGVGVADTFTFKPGSTADNDIDHYLYGWADPPSEWVAASGLGGSATAVIAPRLSGPQTLYVHAVDRAGNFNRSAYQIRVREGNGPRSKWSFEGNPHDTAFLGDRHGTLRGKTSYEPGAVGRGLTFDGAPETEMSAPHPARTDASFSVAAWVKLNRADGGHYMVIEQQSGTGVGYGMQYKGDPANPGRGKWAFAVPRSETEPGVTDWVLAPNPVAQGVWTHLAAGYDSASKKITMYVNGDPVGSVTRQTLWHKDGPLRIGRSWPGAVDEVQVYERVLSDADVKAMVSRDNVQTGHWKFDEGVRGGNSAHNDVDGGGDGVLRQGAVFIDDGPVNGAVAFDGQDDHVLVSQPAVRTDQSYSVAAWVKADELGGPGKSMNVVSQEGDQHSGFYLQYHGDHNQWVFVRPSADGENPDWYGPRATKAEHAPVTTGAVHLVGTYNAANNEMSLYVNGELAGRTTDAAPAWSALGSLTIGRAKTQRADVSYWRGVIDEVRTYSRVLSPAEIEGIVRHSDVAAASWPLDGNAKDEAGTNNGLHHPDQAWTAGHSEHPNHKDLAVKLDGDDHIQAKRVIDTTKSIPSLALSSWVRLDHKPASEWTTVVAQSGAHTSAIAVGYNGVTDRWVFRMNGRDSITPTCLSEVASGTAGQLGAWTHIAAVYQAGSRTMQLYVNGEIAGTKIAGLCPFAFGESVFDIGRGKYKGTYDNSYLNGAVDDVKVYQRALFSEEVRAIAGRDLSLVHNWRLDEGTGMTTVDSVGPRQGTLNGGAARVDGRTGNAVKFAGPADSVTTEGVDLRTDKNFTVSAWVYLDRDLNCASVCQSDAVSVDGTQTSRFRLGHRVDRIDAQLGRWVFEVPAENGSRGEAAVLTAANQLRTWIFLTGVYDATAKSIRLYVHVPGENRFDDGSPMEPWHATGGLAIGRGKKAGKADHFWPGRVDDVRLYTGDLTRDRVTALYESYGASPPATNLPAADAGHWKFDDNTGDTAIDSSGFGNNVILKNGAGWTSGRAGSAMSLDNAGEFAETTGHVLGENGFSASAWVVVANGSTGRRTVLAQDGTAVSTVSLQYHGDSGKWAVSLAKQDVAGAERDLVLSAEPATVGQWTHLAVTYEHGTGQVRLYVNGRVSTVRAGLSVAGGKGSFGIGRSKGGVEPLAGHVDDVRAFHDVLSEGQIRRIHDDAPNYLQGRWAFDGTPADVSWRNNPTSVAGGASYTDGIRGQALQLNGTSGAAVGEWPSANMYDSFTVAGWAKLTSNTGDATVVSQDGSRMSSFMLQYNKNIKSWIFGAATQDADTDELVYAYSLQQPTLNRWTHLAGVYDFPARQLRLYVDGALAGVRESAPLWTAWGSFAIGRGKVDGQAAGFFNGAIDEVRTDLGAASADEIARWAAYPAPAGGQLNRFVNADNERQTVQSSGSFWNPASSVPAGYRFDTALGQLLPTELPGTSLLYSCRRGSDNFTSVDPSCEGATKLTDLGWAYTTAQQNVATAAVYRCGAELHDSLDATCAGQGSGQLLGHVLAYAALSRYVYGHDDEHSTTVHGVPAGYRPEGTLGLTVLTAAEGSVELFSCFNGVDEFTSTDVHCEGQGAGRSIGRVFAEIPAGVASTPLLRCLTPKGERYLSVQPDCAGTANRKDADLGHILRELPSIRSAQ